jgi:hypothetical protein
VVTFSTNDARGLSIGIIAEALEAVPTTLDLLHAEVEPFGRSVRGSRSMVGEDL